MDRRRFLTASGAAAAGLLAGCTGFGGSDESGGTTTGTAGDDGPTLVVATYGSFIDAPSSSPGAWLKQRFESEFDASVVWQTPTNEVNHFIERRKAGVDVEADVYVGLSADDLVRIDATLEEGLFAEAGDVGDGDVKDGLRFDPAGRAVPFDTGYVSLVYDGTRMTAPDGFEGLLAEEFAGDLITQNPSSSDTGRAFLLHTVEEFGPDGYLDYWADLQANDVRVLGSWDDAYSAWSEGEAPMVTSYSTDRVYANRYDQNLEKHRVRFLNDEGYANPEGMAVFAGTNRPDLARQFVRFMLRPEVQGEIAVRNVAFPATTDAALPESYAKYALEPPTPVTFTYEELQGSVGGWIEDWSQQFAQN
ncbi:thiamine ABC transporter substrate-binding protein [Haloarcula litorea]|uniref:thiamine ABC transporter substrate-binding protein n=1 Tax=Haloarcula litorea TaxID=3032579 RepID=UPI0023E83B44|nr:thiamine ABC transporter substrate-binding protein [Halomicroarcula sp. GDY20]